MYNRMFSPGLNLVCQRRISHYSASYHTI